MCLTIKSGPHTATKDLYVLKLGENPNQKGFVTYYRSFPMLYGKTYESSLEQNFWKNKIERGLHALVASELHNQVGWIDREYWDKSIVRKVIALAKIPIGSTYYVGDAADIASDKLEIIEPLLYNEKAARKETKLINGKQLKVPFLAGTDVNFIPETDCKVWVSHLQKVCESYGIKLM